jgi:hypothetical protein
LLADFLLLTINLLANALKLTCKLIKEGTAEQSTGVFEFLNAFSQSVL